MSYVESLQDVLKRKNKTLWKRLEGIREKAEAVLQYVHGQFPYYTPHGIHHSLAVEEILNWLVLDEVKDKMAAEELFFLIVAAWLHDWGMVKAQDEPLTPEEVRNQHHLRTEMFLEQLHTKVGLELREAEIVGRICRGHRLREKLDTPLYGDLDFGSNILIRRRFLASLLRLADACDVTHSRLPEIIYFNISPQGLTEDHFKRHLTIYGVGRVPDAPHKLRISGVAREPRGAATIEEIRVHIQTELDSVKGFLGQHGIVLDVVAAQVDARGFINEPIRFALASERILDLLIGRTLYEREDVAIRELLQNAIDACYARVASDPKFSVENARIEIAVNQSRVVIEDNGIGMTFDWATKYLAQIGISFYASEAFEQLVQDKYDPISKFGLGILSCFLLGNELTIETKREGSEPCRFIIRNLQEGWLYQRGTRTTPGTQITLELKPSINVDLDISILHYARCVDIPIFLNGEALTHNWGMQSLEFIEYLSKEESQEESRTYTFQTPSFDCTLVEIDATIDGKPAILIANRGIFVELWNGTANNMQVLLGGVIGWINIKKSDIVELSVSRDRIISMIPIIVELVKLAAKDWVSRWKRKLPPRGLEEISYFLENELEESALSLFFWEELQLVVRPEQLMCPEFSKWMDYVEPRIDCTTSPLALLGEKAFRKAVGNEPYTVVLVPEFAPLSRSRADLKSFRRTVWDESYLIRRITGPDIQITDLSKKELLTGVIQILGMLPEQKRKQMGHISLQLSGDIPKPPSEISIAEIVSSVLDECVAGKALPDCMAPSWVLFGDYPEIFHVIAPSEIIIQTRPLVIQIGDHTICEVGNARIKCDRAYLDYDGRKISEITAPYRAKQIAGDWLACELLPSTSFLRKERLDRWKAFKRYVTEKSSSEPKVVPPIFLLDQGRKIFSQLWEKRDELAAHAHNGALARLWLAGFILHEFGSQVPIEREILSFFLD